jgi:predicted DNA binding CopG/RHH family protein
MRDEYDFSPSRPNPYLKKLKKRVTISLGDEVVAYFKKLSEQNGIPYRKLIHLYLQDCARTDRKPPSE